MIARCEVPHHHHYYMYGARGIVVCERWRNSFEAFLSDMGLKPSPTHSIDRIDSNGNYEPSNCRWATKIEQANNTRTNRFLEYKGIRKTKAEWARTMGIKIETLNTRMRLGWSVDMALEVPVVMGQKVLR